MEFNIKLENKYNMDETGFDIGKKEAGKCIINAQVQQKYQAKPGRQEWVTVLACIVERSKAQLKNRFPLH